MSIYYVSTAGNDANNGLGPDASHASNKPWRTVAKALGASGIASGDTVYIGPGVYRETVTVAMTSATAETKVIGDYANAQGFKDGSGVLLAAAIVRMTAYTTDDKTAASAAALLNLSGRDYLTFEEINFVGAPGQAVISATTQTSTNIKFTRCVIQGQGGATTLNVSAAFGVALTWTIDRCIISNLGSFAPITFTHVSGTGADWNLAVTVQNSLILGSTFITKSGVSANLGGGVSIINSTLFSTPATNCVITSGNASASIPSTVYNCVIIQCGTSAALAANANDGQLAEDYNMIIASTARSNVTAGSNSKTQSTYSHHLELGQSWLWGAYPMPFLGPQLDSPIVGFGNQAGFPTTDFLGRPRPSGGGPAWASALPGLGHAEIHNFGVKETTVTDASGVSLKLTGPGDAEFSIPVDAASTAISVKVRYDTNHGTTNKPQATLLANPVIGVTAETVVATAGVDTWDTLSFASQTPTAKGVVKIRLESRAAAGNGIAYFDTVTVV